MTKVYIVFHYEAGAAHVVDVFAREEDADALVRKTNGPCCAIEKYWVEEFEVVPASE